MEHETFIKRCRNDASIRRWRHIRRSHDPKQDKEKKRRKAPSSSSPEKKRPRKRLVRKPKNVSARELSSDSLHRLRDESKEEEYSELVARMRSDLELPQSMEVVEEAVAEVSKPGRVETILPQAREVKKKIVTGTCRSEDNVPKEALGVIDLFGSPSFTNSMINESRTLKGNLSKEAQGAVNSFHNFFDGLDSTASEDYLVTEEDQSRMNEVEAPCLFNEAQQALMLHHEAFLRYREEFKRQEAETRELVEKKYAYKLLSEKLQAELEAARKEHVDLVEQNLAKELEAAKLEVVVAKTKADDKVVQFKADIEAIQEQARNMVIYARDVKVEEIEHGQNGEFKLMLECLLEGENKEQNALEEILENSLQNDLVLERLNLQMGEMLEDLEVQKSSKVNDSQEPYLEVEAKNPSLALDQNQEELSNAQNERMMLMVSPCGNVSDISYTRALIIAFLLDGIPVNVGHYILRELREYLHDDNQGLMFPSLITKLCRQAEVEVRSTDHWLPADKPFHPLRVTGEGSAVKSKKRKVTIVGRSELEASYGNLAKAHVDLQSDFEKEKARNKKKGKFMIKMWRGIKAIFQWGQPKRKIHVVDGKDSEEYSFMSSAADDTDDDEAESSQQQ
ncbi:uncharacterized protein [Nicotiana tomentosiformis]|uniref:uncharacterized protein n=1 Tax=Nicotiana tomentosiformis TaxID=4098 RepID=UPI00388C7C74